MHLLYESGLALAAHLLPQSRETPQEGFPLNTDLFYTVISHRLDTQSEQFLLAHRTLGPGKLRSSPFHYVTT